VRVAEELGIRYADSVAGGMFTDFYVRLRERCTAASLDEIMRRHNVSRAEIAAVTGARELWIDLLVVFLPMTAVFLVMSRRVVRRIVAGYDPEDCWVAIAERLAAEGTRDQAGRVYRLAHVLTAAHVS
jgi:hypothetical protein